jgi:cell division protein FtsZ
MYPVNEPLTEEKPSFDSPLVQAVKEDTIDYSNIDIHESEKVMQEELQDPEKIQNDRKQKLKQLSEKLKIHPSLDTNLYEIESVPAYKRRNIPLTDIPPSSESQAPNYTVPGNSDKNANPINENKFLHNKAD